MRTESSDKASKDKLKGFKGGRHGRLDVLDVLLRIQGAVSEVW